MRIRRARRRLGRILAAGAVHVVHLLGLRVVRLELVVTDRPRRRDAVLMLPLAEIFLAKPVERGAVHLRRPADKVMDARLKWLAVLVAPYVGRHVAILDEDLLGDPILRLAREEVAALQEQDLLARRGQMANQRAAAGAATDNDHVELVGHVLAPSPNNPGRAGGYLLFLRRAHQHHRRPRLAGILLLLARQRHRRVAKILRRFIRRID